MKPPPKSAIAAAPTTTTTSSTETSKNRRVRFPPDKIMVTRRIPPPATHDIGLLLESGLVWYRAAEIQQFQVQDLREAARQQREERRHPQKKKLPTGEWTSRGLESLSRDRARAKDQAGRDRRKIIKAYKQQQKQHDTNTDDNPTTTTTTTEEDLRQLYLTLSKEALERAVGYGKYDAAQAQEADEKENQQHQSTTRNKKWTHPIQNMKGYFKSKGQQHN